jgi:hypothetical protein
LRFLDTEEETYFLFEYDCGEMPAERYCTKFQTCFAKKMAIYLAANRNGVHTSELGIPHFRVVTVTTTSARLDQMIDALERLTDGRGSNIFLFADQTQLAATDPFNLSWTTGKRELIRLTD